MNAKISKTNENLEFFNSRLDEVRMSGHERLKAKAQLARAEAMADMVFDALSAIGRFAKTLFAKPAPASNARRTATHAG